MAAIARFVSFDGGIAFSDSVLKIQKRDEERGRLIPIERIAGVEVDEPLLGDDGCIRVQIAGERTTIKNMVRFDEEQYDDALSFKAAFDSFMGRSAQALPPLEMFQPTSIAQRPQRKQARYIEQEQPRRPARRTGRKRRFKWWYAAIAVVFVAILATPGKKDNEEKPQQESAVYATMEPTASPEPTVGPTESPELTTEPTPAATPFVGYTSPPAATASPATQEVVQTETLVWIPTNGGTKYHSKSSCSNMDNPQQVTLSEAQARGFTACKRCY